MRNSGAGRAARLGLLCALALGLGWLEAQLPMLPMLPGVKLGLANTVLLYALVLMRPRDAWALMLTRVCLAGLLYAGFVGFCYSLAGGALSLCVMYPLSRMGGVSLVGVSIGGAAAHNLGQLCVAAVLVGWRTALAYMPLLLLSGIVTGALTGICAGLVLRALKGNKQ